MEASLEAILPGRREWPRSLGACLALAAAAAVLATILWPGHMNADTVGTFWDAESGRYSDWHSAIWTAIWRGLLLVGLRSPGWMLAAGVAMMLTGIYLILRVRLSRPLALIVALAVFAFPPVLSFAIVIGTDSWFLASLLCAFGFAIRAARTGGASRSTSAALAVVFAVLAQAARPTAAPAVLTLLVAVALVVLAPTIGGWRRVMLSSALGAVAAVLVFGAVLGAQRFVLHAAATHPEQETYEYDLVALSVSEHQVLLPASVYPRQDLAYLERYATAGGFVDITPLLWGSRATIPTHVDGAQLGGLQHAWLTEIRQHPYDYLRLRLEGATWQLAIRGPELAVYYGPPPPDWFGSMLHPRIDAWVTQYTAAGTTGNANGGPLQVAWVYLVGLVLTAAANILGRHTASAVLALLSLGILLYTLEILLLSPGITYRYVHPAITTATVLFVVLVASTAGWLRSRFRLTAYG